MVRLKCSKNHASMQSMFSSTSLYGGDSGRPGAIGLSEGSAVHTLEGGREGMVDQMKGLARLERKVELLHTLGYVDALCGGASFHGHLTRDGSQKVHVVPGNMNNCAPVSATVVQGHEAIGLEQLTSTGNDNAASTPRTITASDVGGALIWVVARAPP
ncbi:hypothetical protein E2C01_047669 [Portunus trituberculatus]|uniref:Uncharacterized protein n=1 Tax=Portunus trituberculatus TaxID=210409 RepID=A0A5B7G837_PORTR|nr:hypothetical protein [Portunus trituberculatus]